jgi:hypothetical protein
MLNNLLHTVCYVVFPITTDFAFEMGLTAGVTGGQGVLTPPRHLIPLPVCPGVCVSPFIYLTCNSYLCFETDHFLVSWPFRTNLDDRQLCIPS